MHHGEIGITQIKGDKVAAHNRPDAAHACMLAIHTDVPPPVLKLKCSGLDSSLVRAHKERIGRSERFFAAATRPPETQQDDNTTKDAVSNPLLDTYLSCTGLVPLQSIIHREQHLRLPIRFGFRCSSYLLDLCALTRNARAE
jgi:hypothetical protein